MGKKLTDADKWKYQRWFRKLPPYYKLAFQYVHGICDLDGTWLINLPDLLEDTLIPAPFNLLDFVEKCNVDYDPITGEQKDIQRLVFIGKEYLWLTDHIKEQQEGMEFRTVNHKGNFARSALTKLAQKGTLWEGLVKGYIPLSIPLSDIGLQGGDPSKRVLDIDKERDKEIIRLLYPAENSTKKPAKGVAAPESIPAGAPPASLPPVVPEMTKANFDEWALQLTNDKLFTEPLMMTKGIEPRNFGRWIIYFNAHIAGEGKTKKKNYAEYRQHFKNWIMKKGGDELPPVKNGAQHGAASNGTPAGANKADKYRTHATTAHA